MFHFEKIQFPRYKKRTCFEPLGLWDFITRLQILWLDVALDTIQLENFGSDKVSVSSLSILELVSWGQASFGLKPCKSKVPLTGLFSISFLCKVNIEIFLECLKFLLLLGNSVNVWPSEVFYDLVAADSFLSSIFDFLTHFSESLEMRTFVEVLF